MPGTVLGGGDGHRDANSELLGKQLAWGVLNDNVFPTMGREIQGPYQVRLGIS